MSTNPNDFFNQTPSDEIKHTKESTQDTPDAAGISNTNVKRSSLGLLVFLKKHQNFLLLQSVLLVLIGLSFLFW